MSYLQALEAAGAEVLDSAHFGSYQGDWIALVNYKGQRGFVIGAYGSCSGCDAFEAEFGYSEDGCNDHYYNPQADCEGCKAVAQVNSARLAEFGRSYLEDVDGVSNLWDYDAMLKKAQANIEWDYDAQEMVNWVESMIPKYNGSI